MATTTTNLSLRKPESTDYVDVLLDIAGNMDTIDNVFGTATGHDHDGTDSKKVDPSNLAHKVKGSEIESTTNADKIVTDNIKNLAVTLAKMLSATGTATVGTAEATASHGLGTTPTVLLITMTSAGTIYKSTASNSTNIFLTADAANRTCGWTVLA